MSSQQAVRLSCATAEEARQAIDRLLSLQVPPCDIEVISSEPIGEIGSPGVGKSRLPVFVITGAVLGMAIGFLLPSAAARLYPIHTGGMPILSFLPIGIITYEMMMLFSVLFSLGGLLLEAKLLRPLPRNAGESGVPNGDGEILVLARTRAIGD